VIIDDERGPILPRHLADGRGRARFASVRSEPGIADVMRPPGRPGRGFRPLALAVIVGVTMAAPGRSPAQVSSVLRWGARGTLTATRVEPRPGGDGRTEFQFERPMLTLNGGSRGGHVRFSAAISLDRLTTSNGVPTVGAWGDGWYDRAHPHDYLHEAVVSFIGDVGPGGRRGSISLSAGKGMAPFGSDPTMMRPALRAPVNEHWTQIMDRWLVVLGMRFGRVGFEGGVFDSGSDRVPTPISADTSAHPGDGCFTCDDHRGVSHSARLTLWPGGGVELRASAGVLTGGGHHSGSAAGRENQWHLTGRWDRAIGGSNRIMLLGEFQRNRGDRSFGTFLAEGQWEASHRHRLYYRFERTDRPEGPRTADGYRSAPDTLGAPPGITRWTVHTAGYRLALPLGTIELAPVVEASVGRVRSVGTPPVDLALLYGRRTIWSVVAGLRVAFGRGHVMGRYGALAEPVLPAAPHH
jgi:hypothetical protein